MTTMTSNSKSLVLKASEMKPHPTAQRALVSAHVKKIREELDLDKVGTIHVVRYPIADETGTTRQEWWIVDGQHRHAALIEEGLGDWPLNVIYYPDATDDARASDLFLGLNARRNTSAYDRFINEVRAGYPDSVEIKSVVDQRGLRLHPAGGDGCVAAVTALKNIHKRGGPDALGAALDTAANAWGKTASAMDGKILEGLGLVFATYNGQVDRAALVKKLAKYPGGASALLGNAKGRREWAKTSITRSVGEIVVELYNRHRRTGILEGF